MVNNLQSRQLHDKLTTIFNEGIRDYRQNDKHLSDNPYPKHIHNRLNHHYACWAHGWVIGYVNDKNATDKDTPKMKALYNSNFAYGCWENNGVPFSEGYNACVDNDPQDSNPYMVDSFVHDGDETIDYHAEWNRGYTIALNMLNEFENKINDYLRPSKRKIMNEKREQLQDTMVRSMIKHGRDAYLKGKSLKDNPCKIEYQPNCHALWEQGWKEARSNKTISS